MKKNRFLAAILAASLIFSTAACSSDSNSGTGSGYDETAVTEENSAETETNETEKGETEAVDGSAVRHPLFIAADTLKAGITAMGFSLVENGEGMEVQTAGTNFAVWAEPDTFSWKNTPVSLTDGKAEMRTRLLPGYLKNNATAGPAKIAAFGNVYNSSTPETYKGTEIEGLIIDSDFGEKDLQEFWDRYAVLTFGGEYTAVLKKVDSSFTIDADETAEHGYVMNYGGLTCYEISVEDADDGIVYTLGYTGPVTEEALAVMDIDCEIYQAWGFAFDVAAFAVQYIDGVDSIADLGSYDVDYLSRFTSDKPAYGGDANYAAVDIMRKLGYTEVLGDVIYEPDAYIKMNMIQEEWDSNNSGVQLVEEIDGKTGLRTVMTPALEEALSQNYASGREEVRLFEVGHIFSVVEDSDLPYERVSICFMAYGPDVTMESFTADVEAFLAEYGMTDQIYTTTDVAIAYVVGECTIALDPVDYSTPGNYGPISEIALENYKIGTQAYMANFEITTLKSY